MSNYGQWSLRRTDCENGSYDGMAERDNMGLLKVNWRGPPGFALLHCSFYLFSVREMWAMTCILQCCLYLFFLSSDAGKTTREDKQILWTQLMKHDLLLNTGLIFLCWVHVGLMTQVDTNTNEFHPVSLKTVIKTTFKRLLGCWLCENKKLSCKEGCCS